MPTAELLRKFRGTPFDLRIRGVAQKRPLRCRPLGMDRGTRVRHFRGSYGATEGERANEIGWPFPCRRSPLVAEPSPKSWSRLIVLSGPRVRRNLPRLQIGGPLVRDDHEIIRS